MTEQQPVKSADVRNAIAREFMRVGQCEKSTGIHGPVCTVHGTTWLEVGCLQAIEGANDVLVPVMDVIRRRILPSTH